MVRQKQPLNCASYKRHLIRSFPVPVMAVGTGRLRRLSNWPVRAVALPRSRQVTARVGLDVVATGLSPCLWVTVVDPRRGSPDLRAEFYSSRNRRVWELYPPIYQRNDLRACLTSDIYSRRSFQTRRFFTAPPKAERSQTAAAS